MTNKYEAGFAWHPIGAPKSQLWLRTVCVIVVSVAIGFVAGRSSVLTTQPEPAVPDTETKAAAAVPLAPPEIAVTRSIPPAPKEPTPYVVINRQVANEPGVEPPHNSSDIKEMSKNTTHKKPADIVEKRFSRTSSTPYPASRAAPVPASPQSRTGARDYLALRDYVLKR
jgi:hypothetical protein